MVQLKELRGPLFHGVAVEKNGRVLVAVMTPSLHLAVKDRAINATLLRAGWGQGEIVNAVVASAQGQEH